MVVVAIAEAVLASTLSSLSRCDVHTCEPVSLWPCR